jgi:hypothetical protein
MTQRLTIKKRKDFSKLKNQSKNRIPRYLLLKEYEMIQQKIDNYGSSDISYKALVVTITAGSILANDKLDLNSSVLLLSCLVIFIILLSVGRNDIYIGRLVNRAQMLEKSINKDCSIKHFPGIVQNTIRDQVMIDDVLLHVMLYCEKFLLYYIIMIVIFYHYIKSTCMG